MSLTAAGVLAADPRVIRAPSTGDDTPAMPVQRPASAAARAAPDTVAAIATAGPARAAVAWVEWLMLLGYAVASALAVSVALVVAVLLTTSFSGGNAEPSASGAPVASPAADRARR